MNLFLINCPGQATELRPVPITRRTYWSVHPWLGFWNKSYLIGFLWSFRRPNNFCYHCNENFATKDDLKYHVENIVKKQSSGGNNGYRNGNFNRNIIKIITIHVRRYNFERFGRFRIDSPFPIGSDNNVVLEIVWFWGVFQNCTNLHCIILKSFKQLIVTADFC